MMINQTIQNLNDSLKERVLRLLKNPYAGSKAFEYNHPNAKYNSNCHGTIVYLLDLDKSGVSKKQHLTIVPSYKMEEILSKEFLPKDYPHIGDIVSFYEISQENEKILIHTTLLVGQNQELFHQSGYGGIFQTTTFEKELRRLSLFNQLSFEYHRKKML